MPADALSLTIPPETEAVPRLLDAIEAWCDTHGIGPAVGHRLGVVVEELAANVAMHGTGGPDGASFVAVTIREEQDAIVAVIEDDGRAFDPLAMGEVDTDLPLEEREIGGLGVHFAKVMTRELAYARADGRNRVTAVFDAG